MPSGPAECPDFASTSVSIISCLILFALSSKLRISFSVSSIVTPSTLSSHPKHLTQVSQLIFHHQQSPKNCIHHHHLNIFSNQYSFVLLFAWLNYHQERPQGQKNPVHQNQNSR